MEIIRKEMDLNDDYFVCFPLIKTDDRPNRLSGVVAADIDEIKLYVVDNIGFATYTIDASTQFFPIAKGWYKLVIPGGLINKIAGTNHVITIEHDGTKNFDTQTLIVRFVKSFGENDCNVVSVNGDAVSSVNDFKADVSGLSTFDASEDEVLSNIKKVNDVAVTSVDDFKADVNELQCNSNVIAVDGNPVTSVNDFKADVSGLSTFDPSEDEVLSNIQKVKGVPVTSVDDFKADVNGISCNSNVVSVNGNAVSSVNDFKADVSGLSTFDPSEDEVLSNIKKVNDVEVDSVEDFKGAFSLTEEIDGMTLSYIFQLMAAMANGNYDISTNAEQTMDTITIYKRDGAAVLTRFELTATARRLLL